MKKRVILGIGVLSFVGLSGFVGSSPAFAEGGQMIYHKYQTMWHKDVKLPLRNVAIEIRERVNDMLNAILEGNYEAVKENAEVVSAKGHQIINTYFPHSLDIEAFKKDPKTSHLQPEALESFVKLREDFMSYFGRIDSGLQEIKKAADARDEGAALDAFHGLIKKTCVECHKEYRD
ncbi:MAG: hypothetical protein E3K32_01335 [wastewater metagenome]|nr:hypothetical protein [Candidatus Loosdrechtia aerotolerans]